MKLFRNLTSGFRGEKFWRISLKSTQCKKPPPHGSHVFDRSVLWTMFEKGHTRNNLVKLFQILTCHFGEEDFLRISSCSYSAKCSHSRIKLSQIFFEKGHQREIPVKLFQNLSSGFREDFLKIFLRISSYPYIVQEAPIHQSHVSGRIKISQTIFKKGHPRNIPVKLFQNQTKGFREEDFLRISLCLYKSLSSVLIALKYIINNSVLK